MTTASSSSCVRQPCVSRSQRGACTHPQVDARYICQLRVMLTWRQSIGIVGGRPGASLYFIGFQNEHVLYLDPHEVQEVLPTLNPKPNPNNPSLLSALDLRAGGARDQPPATEAPTQRIERPFCFQICTDFLAFPVQA